VNVVFFATDNKEELLEAVVRHGVKVHGCQDTPEFREKIIKGMKEGIPRTILDFLQMSAFSM